MAVRNLALVSAALLVCILVGGGGYPQAPVGQPPAPGLPEVGGPGVTIPAPYAVTPSVQQPPPPKTVDQLIEDLTEVRRQKAELEKKEQAVVKQLRDRLKEQTDRLSKLGIEPQPAPIPKAEASTPGLPVIPGIGAEPSSR